MVLLTMIGRRSSWKRSCGCWLEWWRGSSSSRWLLAMTACRVLRRLALLLCTAPLLLVQLRMAPQGVLALLLQWLQRMQMHHLSMLLLLRLIRLMPGLAATLLLVVLTVVRVTPVMTLMMSCRLQSGCAVIPRMMIMCRCVTRPTADMRSTAACCGTHELSRLGQGIAPPTSFIGPLCMCNLLTVVAAVVDRCMQGKSRHLDV